MGAPYLVLVATLALAGCPGRSAGGLWIDPAVEEPSGLVGSRQYAGVLWTHADSGGSAQLYAVNTAGALLGTVSLQGATNVDWEAISVDDGNRLYVGDIGNNTNDRKNLVVYRVSEPSPVDGQQRIERTIAFRYAEQRAFPDESALNFDAEALFYAQGSLYLLTKHRSDSETALYRFPDLSGAAEVALLERGSFDLGEQPSGTVGMVTDASATPDGRYLAVLTYHALFVFERPSSSDDYLSQLRVQIPFDVDTLGQCEAIAWEGTTLWIANEAGRLFRLDDPLGGGTTRFPRRP